MRNAAAILLKCAVIGLVVTGQRTAFGAEPGSLKLRLSSELATPENRPIAQTEAGIAAEKQLEQQFGSSGLLLRLSRSTAPPPPPGNDGSGDMNTPAVAPRRPADEKPDTITQLAQSAKNTATGPGIFGLGLAPIRWGGYTTDVFRMMKSSDRPLDMNHSQRLDLRATSYLWQPWFATVSGGIGLSRGVQDSGDRNGESKSSSLTGFGDFSLFPQSRFPFSAAFSVSDSSTSTPLTSDDMQSKRFSLRQAYRPPTGDSNYSVAYQNSTMTSKLNGDDVVETWQGSYSTSLGQQHIGLDVDRTETSRSQNKEGLVLNSVNARHSYSPAANLSVDSNARISDSVLRIRSSNEINTTSSRYSQASSFATWRPKEELALNVTAGLNYFDASSAINDVSNQTQSLSGNLSATYNPTRNLSLGASGTIVAVNADSGSTSITSTQSGNASYNGDPLTLGNFSYNWNVSGSATNQTSDSGSSQTFSTGGSHGLSRDYRLSALSSLHLGVNQALTVNWVDQNGQSSNLSSSGSLAWQISPSDSMSGTVSLSATDTRTMGALASDNQFISLQSNGRIQLSTYATASANFNIQWNRQGTSGLDAGGEAKTTIYTSGSANYQHSRAFGINNLRYSGLANINMQQSNARLLGDANADANPVGYSLEQHLDYRIGRIDIGLTGTISVQDGKENALLFLQVGRTFGNY
ncbi:MAG TPA: hypothetical protein VGK14_08105 [Novimethylophilus sp.]|jgi:hypothetical protein|uniref:hypothetical protein n=1 Tax=Novimethylophilus sp. TaxID=2137426 RepID=UPI002F4041FB